MRHSLLLQPVSAGVVAAFVGFASSFAVVLKGLSAVGASDAQAASGLMALAIAVFTRRESFCPSTILRDGNAG
jgi:benzoate membrane transport protein